MHYESQASCVFQWRLDIDLQEDFNSRVYADLKRVGYMDADRKHAVFQYYNLRKRQIEAKQRNVVRSKEFECPAGYELALQEFEEKAKRGDNLIPFQSEKIKDISYNDMLLNDWGIQHFHLTRRFRADGFAQRSQYQIFAYITASTVYMIQVFPHNAENLYSRRELVRILRDNWPELMERFHIKGVTGLTEKIDDHDYGELRKANITTFLELGDNEVYGMIGGGYASNGDSMEALLNAGYLLNLLSLGQLWVKDKSDRIGRTINQLTKREGSYCDLQVKLLWIDANEITMCETNSGLILQLNIKERWLRICWPHEVFGYDSLGRLCH